ncbi:MAG: SNF2 helicase associated domain-containing protein, partial [Kiritimatiellae bacterium]|nr:SNF2 helicase associated domain-containing protein [Kiritimatiellia bacterium]
MVKSGITKEELIEWGGAEVFNQALAIVNSGDVTEAVYDDDKLEIRGKIQQPSGWEMPLSLSLKPGGRIESHCPCETNRRYGMVCPHVVALGLVVVVREMDDVEAERRREEESAPEEVAAEEDCIEVEMKPKIFAFLQGSRASLSIEIDAHYGDIEFPACSVQGERTVYLPSPDDPLVRFVRSIKFEREAFAAAEKFGFEKGYREGDLRLYLTDPQKVLNFLGAGLPALRRRGWRIDLAEKLMELTDSMPSVVPVVTVRDAPGGAFDVSYVFDAMGRDVSPVEIQAALNRGDGYIMRDGKVILLDNSAIEAMHAVFRDCATSQNGARPGWFRVSSVHAPYVKASLDLLDSIDVDDEKASKWRETAALRNREGNAKFESVALGPLDGILRPYQKQGVYWMRFLERSGL